MRIQLGTSSSNAANYCLVYNYYAGVANPTTCTATPSQGATGNNGNVMGYLYQDPVNTSLQHSVAYTFDGVNRLASATAKDLSSNTLWAQSYIYTADTSNGQFGNMTCMLGGSGYCPQVTFSASTNRVSKVGSLNASYDSAGNMTGDGTHTYQWDAEDRMVSMDSGSTATYKYNVLGQRVERFLTNGSWTFDYLFGVGGEELGLYNAGGATWFDQNVPMGGRLLVLYGSPLRMLHTNNLGSTTVVTDQTGAELEDQVAYPWGQTWSTAGLGYDRHFAGMHQPESPEALNPTDFRKYNPALGRWMSPDPLAGDVSNPQSLNRYAYVLNNPVSNTDPSGLEACPKSDDAATVDPMHPHTCIDVVSNNPPPIDVGLMPSLGTVLPGDSNHDGTEGTVTNKGPQEVKKQCVDYYRSSPAGKVATFMDPVANLKDTLLLETGKFGLLKGLNAGAKASPDLEVLSITGAKATKVVPGVLESVTGWGLGLLEKLAPGLAVASGTAALADLTVQSTCSSISYGLPPPSLGF